MSSAMLAGIGIREQPQTSLADSFLFRQNRVSKIVIFFEMHDFWKMTKEAVVSFTNPLQRVRGMESGTEKLLHNTTLGIIGFLFFLLASKPLFGSPITCQVPSDWPSSSVEYFTHICYFGEREKMSFQQKIRRSNGKGIATINMTTGTSDFYMWIPLIPIALGSLCLLPVLFWKFIGLNCCNGMDIISVLEYYCSDENREILVDTNLWRTKKLADQLHKWIAAKRDSIGGQSRTMMLYVAMKWFRAVLLAFQFWIIAYVFGDGDLSWGYDRIVDIANGVSSNPFHGAFTLITGCRVQRLNMGIGSQRYFTNAHSVKAMCMLSANFINAKAFLFLYWWFLFVSIVSILSAINFTIILLSPIYRRYNFYSIVRNEDYFMEHCGEPHPELKLSTATPLEYFVDYLGNDGFLIVLMVYDMLNYHACNRLAECIWIHLLVNNGEMVLDEPEKIKKVPNVDGTELDGRGDRYYCGKEKKKVESPSTVRNNANSCNKASLSTSQPSILISTSDEDPLINTAISNSISV